MTDFKLINNNYYIAAIISTFCICLNILGQHIAYDNSYKFLYLDMIGTLIGSMLLGPLWGTCVALFSNSIVSLKNSSFAYYTVVNVTGALYWGGVTNLGINRIFCSDEDKELSTKTIKIAFIYIISVGLFGGLVSSIPASIIHNVAFAADSGSYSSVVTKKIMDSFNSDANYLVYIADALLSVPDKIISAAFGMVTIISLFRHFGRNIAEKRQRFKLRYCQISLPEIFLLSIAIFIYLACLVDASKYQKPIYNAYYLLDFTSPQRILMNVTLLFPIISLVIFIIFYLIQNKLNGTIVTNSIIGNSIEISKAFLINVIAWLIIVSVAFYGLFHWVGKFPSELYQNEPYQPSVWIVTSLLVLLFTIFLIDQINCDISARVALEIKDRVRRETEIDVLGALAHQLKHKILPARFNISEALEHASEVNDLELSASLEKTSTLLEQMDGQLKSVEKLFTNTIQQFEIVNISSVFTKQIMPNHVSDKFEIICDIPDKIQYYVNVPVFVDAMTNLIRNAEMHAFDSPSDNNCVRFNVRMDDSKLIIDYLNTGKPLPQELTEQTFLTYGKKRSNSPGQGIGGAYIDKMIHAHNGTLIFIPAESPYNVHFRITLNNGRAHEV